MIEREPLQELTKDLAAVATGRKSATLVIRNGRWVNVHAGQIVDHTDIAVFRSRIAYCGPDATPMIDATTEVIDADEAYLVPGLLDAHMHVESSMLTLSQFANAVMPHGTTGVFIDPHEIANVLGLDGVRMIIDEASKVPMHIYVQVPSCVPAAPSLETSGGTIGPTDVAEAMKWPQIIGLGEVMNYLGVASGDATLHAELSETLRAGRTIGGHYASPELGATFHGYVAAGIGDCHEGTRAEDAVARVQQGMYAMLRQGSAWHDLCKQLPAITKDGLDSRRFLLCTDDRHPGTLISKGHMDDLVRLTIEQGIDPTIATQMATLNTAERFGVSHDVGGIAPGRYADILLVSNIARMTVDLVIASGDIVANSGRMTASIPSHVYPEQATRSVHLSTILSAQKLEPTTPIDDGEIRARLIEVIENQAVNQCKMMTVSVSEGMLKLPENKNLNMVAVVERHRGSGRISHGLVAGFALQGNCALASTVSHDSHNLLIMGTNSEAMAYAGNLVAEMNGGVCLVKDNAILAKIPLPIAGLMSNASARTVAKQVDGLHHYLIECGCSLNNAFMTFSLLALPVIPELRLTDKGLVDVESLSFVSLFESMDNPA